jgi:zinc protease
MRINELRILAAGAVAFGTVAACAPAAPVPAPAPVVEAPRPRLEPPPPLAARPVVFPPFHETQLPNGLQLVVLEHTAQPIVSVNLYVRSGGALDPAQRAGLAGMTADLLTKGTARRTAQQIAETIEGVGGNLNASAGDDWMTVSASVLPEHLPLAMDLLSDVTLRPNFPQTEFDLARQRTLSGLQAALGQPGEIARRRFLREVYGPEHPYGMAPVPGTIEAIRRADLQQFHRQHVVPNNAMLVVAGDVRRDEVEALVRRHFGDWRRGTVPAVQLPAVPQREPTRIYLVHRPGSVQSNIWVGHPGVRPDEPDFFALQVLNQILGGGTDARLFQILREQKGWTYGAYSRFTRPRDVGFFAANAEVRTEVTDSAVAEIMHQLRRLRTEQVPAEDVEAAKSFLAGSFPLRLETAGQIASQVAQARLLGVPIEMVTEYPLRIRAVTREDVQRAAQQHVRPDQAAIVVVGDAMRVLPMLDPLGTIVLYDVEGQPIDRSALEVRAATERFDGTRLQPQTLAYQFMVQGNPMGTVTSQLTRDGDDWVGVTTTESPMMTQRIEVRFRAADMAPVSSQMSMTQGPMRMQAELRVQDGRVIGQAQLPEQMGGDRQVDTEIVQGTLLPGMDEYVLRAADLSEGRTITLPVYDLMSGSVANVSYRVAGAENVTTPAGSFPAFRVEVVGAPQPITLFVRQQAPHVMLRQEFAGMPIAIELQEIR